jgi:hypothetical protein
MKEMDANPKPPHHPLMRRRRRKVVMFRCHLDTIEIIDAWEFEYTFKMGYIF